VAERVLESFVSAVQAEDLDALYCLLAGASGAGEADRDGRARFDAWAAGRYREYLEGRDRGAVELEEDGLTLVKAFALGRGTFYRVVSTTPAGPGELAARTEVRFGYAQANYATFSPGTTFYLAGDPPGSIVAVQVPRESREITREVRDTIDLEWALAEADATEDCPERWTVASVRPLPGTATTTLMTWAF